MIDGNFTADHLKMRHPENDVCLTPGGRYMVEPTRYEAHLQAAVDYQEVSSLSIDGDIYTHCTRNQHVLITRQLIRLTPHKHTFKPLELEQLHVPAMGVSFHNRWLTFKREKGLVLITQMNPCSLGPRQMNIDYAVCQSLWSMGDISLVIAIYDVACQWFRNFLRRVKNGKYLAIPPNLSIVPAVGKWHLGAHVVDCFPKFSLNFI